MTQNTVSNILEEVSGKINTIFGDTIVFAFVCGGFAKGYADQNHDVDIFVCTKEKIDPSVERIYLDWYFKLHQRYRLKADYNYPGEIIIYENLIQTLNILKGLQLSLTISDVPTKKAIIWADMITGVTAAEIGPGLDLLAKLKKEYAHYPEKWKQEVLNLIPNKDRGQWEQKSHLLIMEHFMRYPKHDGQNLERVYMGNTYLAG